MTLRRTSVPVDPKCYWCHESIDYLSPHRGHDPEAGLPPGVYVVICGPDCKARPEQATVGLRVNWRAA